MDVVYVTREGSNPELMYSMRSLVNIDHDGVWVIGGIPYWVDKNTTSVIHRTQSGSPGRSTQEHIRAACSTASISDPFMLWNDDFFATKPVENVPLYHRGSLGELMDRVSTLRTPWAKGLREAAAILIEKKYPDPMSYDLHVPMVVHKEEMREALRWASRTRTGYVHLRTLYGNLVGGGEFLDDPKLLRKSDPFPTGPWLSSSSDTFRSTVEPVLRFLFPEPSKHETVRP